MYPTVLLVHSYVRWLVLLTGLLAVARGIGGWRSGRLWTLTDERAGTWFSIALDLQFLIGLGLYFLLSPITSAALHDFSGAMSNSVMRFWAVEHVTGMFIGIGLTHIGRSRIHKTGDDRRRHRLATIFFGLALLAIVASIPWPGMPYGRPLFRW